MILALCLNRSHVKGVFGLFRLGRNSSLKATSRYSYMTGADGLHMRVALQYVKL